MARVTKQFIERDIESRMFSTFSRFFNYSLDDKNAEIILSEFFTPTERTYLAKRFMIAYFLTKGVDWLTITKVLKVSLSTVGNVSQRLGTGEGYLANKLDKFFKASASARQTQGFLDEMLDTYVDSFKGMGYHAAKLHRQEHEGEGR